MMGPLGGNTEVGEVVGSFPEYTGAQKAVSALIQAEIPAREIAIVGRGLRSIERITGKLGYATAARQGAVNGIFLGLIFSLVLTFGVEQNLMQLFLGCMVVGVALGMLMSLIAYTLIRRRRDYASVMQVVADHYEVTVMPTSIHKARQVLGTAPGGHRPPARPAAPASNEPPRYGERVDPAATRPAAQPPAAPASRPSPANEPPRYGVRVDPSERPATAQPPAPPAPSPAASGPEQPPRFGVRVDPVTGASADEAPAPESQAPTEASAPATDAAPADSVGPAPSEASAGETSNDDSERKP
ncbi:general stress protein [Microbacterium gorillae]|uniref:general stress protein n=1 Tax=Microbacterium gorillae TaxID=1231063 RepID=UPI003D97A5BD